MTRDSGLRVSNVTFDASRISSSADAHYIVIDFHDVFVLNEMSYIKVHATF